MLRICAFAPPPPGPVENEGLKLHYRTTPSISVERSGIEPDYLP
jgi:hypothetical protein